MRKAASSPRPCGANPIASCFWTRWKRRIPMCSIFCFRCWMTAASPTARAARWISKNTIIIMTSNLGSQYLLDGIENGQITQSARDSVMQLLRTQFRPEFLNRIDDIVFYKPLEKDEIAQIVRLLAGHLASRLHREGRFRSGAFRRGGERHRGGGVRSGSMARVRSSAICRAILETVLARRDRRRRRAARADRPGGRGRKRRAYSLGEHGHAAVRQAPARRNPSLGAFFALC